MCSRAAKNKDMTTRGAQAPKKVPLIKPTTPQVAAQGTAQASEMVNTLCPQESMTLVPAAPPMVQAKLTRNGSWLSPASQVWPWYH